METILNHPWVLGSILAIVLALALEPEVRDRRRSHLASLATALSVCANCATTGRNDSSTRSVPMKQM